MKELEALNRNFEIILFYMFFVCSNLDFDLKQVRVKSDQYKKYLYIKKNSIILKFLGMFPAL